MTTSVKFLVMIVHLWLSDCAKDGVNWLNIESGSTPPVIKSSAGAKCFRFSSLVSVCPEPSLSKVWWRSVLCIFFFYFKNEICKKNSKGFCEKLKKTKKRIKAPIFTTLYSMEVQVISKPKIKVLGPYVLHFIVQVIVLSG